MINIALTFPKLASCPFCSSDEVDFIFGGSGYVGVQEIYVNCGKCGATGPRAKGEDYDEEIHNGTMEQYMVGEAAILWGPVEDGE